jgi:tRNA (guanine37-N1)-methyltransferase
VMKPEPLSGAIEKVLSESSRENGRPRIIYLSPGGRAFTQGMAEELAALPELTLLCGHYEGIDQRIIDHYVTDEISVGDYILSSGVTAAMVVTDAVCRLVRGVISEGSHECESFTGGLLEYPQYTRPRIWLGHEVPEILFSGHHELIRKWRLERSIDKTKKNRPDLLNK